MSSLAGIDAASPQFLDFVACEVCRRDLPDSADPKPVTFFATSCGHIICDEHRDPSNRCSKCHTERISLQVFSRQALDSLAPFFLPVPQTLQEAFEAANYQQRYLLDLLTFFKEKVIKQKAVLDQLKPRLQAASEDQRRVETLEVEVATLRSLLDERAAPPSIPSGSRKRRSELDGGLSRDPARPPRPASTLPTIGPQRVTMTPERRQPSALAEAAVDWNIHRHAAEAQSHDERRPTSGISGNGRQHPFLERFSYAHSRTSATPTPAQMPPILEDGRASARLPYQRFAVTPTTLPMAIPIAAHAQPPTLSSHGPLSRMPSRIGGGVNVGPGVRPMPMPAPTARAPSAMQNRGAYAVLQRQARPSPLASHANAQPPSTPSRAPFYPSGSSSSGGGGGGELRGQQQQYQQPVRGWSTMHQPDEYGGSLGGGDEGFKKQRPGTSSNLAPF